jgi:hypothetical protein
MMNLVIIVIALSLQPGSSSNTILVKTTNGNYQLERTSKNGELILKKINRSIELKRNIALILSGNTDMIINAYWPMKDKVVSISEVPADTNLIKVNLQMRPTAVFFDKRNPEFETTFSLLKLSLKEEVWLVLAINPSNAFIDVAILKE